VSILSFLRKHGETEDPLFADLPVETPPPDLGDVGVMAVQADVSQADPGNEHVAETDF
jgi:hypothetical protein